MDVFGEALRDRQAGNLGRMLTIRRDDNHTDAHDPGQYFANMPFAHEINLLARIQGPVLDVGCGAGRTLLWLERQGIEATGIDLSSGAVAVSRSRGCKDVRHSNFMTDSLDMFAEQTFQTVVLFGNNVGIGGTIEGAADLLHRIIQLTQPGGHVVITGLDIAQTENPRHLEYHRANRSKGRPRGEITMRFEYEGHIGDWVPWFHPEPDELEGLAGKTGWDIVEIKPASGPFYAATLRKPW